MQKKFLLKELEKVKFQIEQLCEYFRSEFGRKLSSGKLVFKTQRCGNGGCPYCPHGPYWYRAVFNPVSRKFIFRYIGVKLKKSMLRKHELQNWNRYNFYNEESKRLRNKKKFIIQQIKKLEKLEK